MAIRPPRRAFADGARTAPGGFFGGSSVERNIRATTSASGIEQPTQTASITNSVVIMMASGEWCAAVLLRRTYPDRARVDPPSAEQRNIYTA
ncbi:hypothetical protein ACQPZ2_11180 [Nocardia pseudovaccinii]|uniref:hypothetical protein n=1 Tax=Nocardia pseudovaccinii TaxID=189540 RepID=UPI003D8B7E96